MAVEQERRGQAFELSASGMKRPARSEGNPQPVRLGDCPSLRQDQGGQGSSGGRGEAQCLICPGGSGRRQHSWAWERDLGLRVINPWNTAILPTSPGPMTSSTYQRLSSRKALLGSAWRKHRTKPVPKGQRGGRQIKKAVRVISATEVPKPVINFRSEHGQSWVGWEQVGDRSQGADDGEQKKCTLEEDRGPSHLIEPCNC